MTDHISKWIGTFWYYQRESRVVELVGFTEDWSLIGLNTWKVRDVLTGWEENVSCGNLNPRLTPLEVLAHVAVD